MKKVAILRCLQTASSCSGAGCLRAAYEKTGAFAEYDEPVQVVAFCECNGCGAYASPNQEGLRKKIERIKALAPDAVHLSNCTKKKNDAGEKVQCPVITAIANEWREAGLNVVEGTH